MDLFDIGIIAVIIMIIGGIGYGIYWLDTTKEIQERLTDEPQFIEDDKVFCERAGMLYFRSFKKYVICFVESPMDIKVLDKVVA